jgi:hypothetical protein
MSALPDDGAVRAFLTRAAARLAIVRAIEGTTLGLLGGLVVVLISGAGLAAGLTLFAGFGLAGGVLRALLGAGMEPAWWRDAPAVADRVERRTPALRNLVLTAAELHGTAGAATDIGLEVERRAAAAARAVDLGDLFPLRGRVAWLAVALLVAVGSLRLATGASPWTPSSPGVPAAIAIDGVDVIVIPPVHAGMAVDTLEEPARIEVLAGSRLRLVVRSTAPVVRLERVAGRAELERAGDSHAVDFVATEDDFLAIAALDLAGESHATRLIGLSVIPDREPAVRVTAPGRDLFFTTVPDTLAVAIEADDDLALASLALRYTWVSGSGERFTFTEREVPVAVIRTDARHWTARTAWRLDTLALTPGDMIVYRAEATDRRPGAAAARSDSYVLEVVGAAATAAEGFAADDERDRYAVSQQMVILKTERLLARRRDLSDGEVADSARRLAAEQRRVRAEFVFMMGGELEDDEALSGTLMVNEEEEAEAESDLLAGRMQNRGRIEMQRAIRAMSRAGALLTNVDLERALADERIALDNLMRSFSRSRILLRALTQRERLDLERRLSGSLVDASSVTRTMAEAPVQARLRALRTVLADVAGSVSDTRGAAARLAEAAVNLVRIDPADDSLRAIAAAIEAAANETGASTGSAGDAIEAASLRLAALMRAMLPSAAGAGPSVTGARLRGEMADAMAGGRSGGSR